MARINKTRYALLGVLSMGPASGYDIKTIMTKSTDHFWKEGDASIYPILSQLLKEKLVRLKLPNTKSNKPKKIYTITSAGKKILQEWLKKEPEPAQVRSELMLKIFFGGNVESEITINHLQTFRNKIVKNLSQYRNSELLTKAKTASLDRLECNRYLALKAGIAHAEAGIKWIDEALGLLNQRSGK
jgi:DNA-binding PadR family transcriptional regulator